MSSPPLSGVWYVCVVDYEGGEPTHDLTVVYVVGYLHVPADELPRALREVAAVFALPYDERQTRYTRWGRDLIDWCGQRFVSGGTGAYTRLPSPRGDGWLALSPSRTRGEIYVTTRGPYDFEPCDRVAVEDLLTPGWLEDRVFYDRLRSIL